MTELDQLIKDAYAADGKQDNVNKVHLTFLRTPLFIGVSLEKPNDPHEPFKPLIAQIDDRYFMLAFDRLERLTAWAGDEIANMNYVELLGEDIILGLGHHVYLGLNFGSDYYKEFSPDEVTYLKKIITKIQQLKK